MKFKDYIEQEGPYISFKDGENRIRIVSDPVNVWKAFGPDKSCKVFIGEAAAKAHDAVTLDPKQRCKSKSMFYVINRTTGKIQICDAGPMIMGDIMKLAKSTEYGFDELPPYDMIVTKTGAGFETEYSVTACRQNTELSEAEKQEIANLEPLSKVISRDAVDTNQAPF